MPPFNWSSALTAAPKNARRSSTLRPRRSNISIRSNRSPYTGCLMNREKMATLKYYSVDSDGKIQRLRRECPSETCGAGIFMAFHKDRQYCGKCHTTCTLILFLRADVKIPWRKMTTNKFAVGQRSGCTDGE